MGMVVIVVVGGESFVGMRISQWSRGEFVGVKVGTRGSPACMSDELVRKSASGPQKD